MHSKSPGICIVLAIVSPNILSSFPFGVTGYTLSERIWCTLLSFWWYKLKIITLVFSFLVHCEFLNFWEIYPASCGSKDHASTLVYSWYNMTFLPFKLLLHCISTYRSSCGSDLLPGIRKRHIVRISRWVNKHVWRMETNTDRFSPPAEEHMLQIY